MKDPIFTARAPLTDGPSNVVMGIEDLAAAKNHGKDTARIGVAEDGNPIIYGTDDANVRAIAESMAKATRVHALVIPPLEYGQFEQLAEQATELTVDLAAARDHGRETARIGFTDEGIALLYGEDRESLERLSEQFTKSKGVSFRHVPKRMHVPSLEPASAERLADPLTDDPSNV